MAETARRSPAGHDAPGWGEYRRQMMARAQDVTAALSAYLAAGGDDAGPQAALAALAIAALIDLGTAARRAEFGEEFAREKQAYARSAGQDRAARPRGRGRLRAVT